MGKEQELFDAARTGNIAFIEKTLSQKTKWAFPVPLPSQLTTTLQRKFIHPNIQDTNGETLLHHASLNGHRDVVEFLLKLQASANIPDQKGCYPLHLAAWRGNAEICQILLSHGPSIAKVNAQNSDGDTALHSAAQYGHTAVVSLLLKHHADPLVRNRKSETALDLACQYGRLEAVQLLLGQSKSLFLADQGPVTATDSSPIARDKSPLHLAARSGHRNVVQALLDAGFNINQKTDDGTALHEASLYGRVEVVRLLLERGIDVNILDCANKSALAIVSDQKTIKSQEIEAIIRAHYSQLTNTRLSLEPVYDQFPEIPTAVNDVEQLCNYERVIGNGSCVPQFRHFIPSISAEEESIYDRPSSQLRVVIPSNDCGKSPQTSPWQDNVQPRSPITPKKPPRKKPPLQSVAMVKDSDPDKKESNPSVSSDGSSCLIPATNFGNSFESSELRLTNGDNNNDTVTPSIVDINNPVDFSGLVETSRGSLVDNDSYHAINNNNRVQIGDNVNTNTACGVVEADMKSSRNSGRTDSSRPHSLMENSPASPRPPDLNMKSKRLTCIVAAPSSPTHYDQPPTPEHPPPSPMTAILGIQEKIQPKDRRVSRDMETITESVYLGGNDLQTVNSGPTIESEWTEAVNTDDGSHPTTNDQRKMDSDDYAVCIASSDKDIFLGLMKGSTTAAGITRRSSDSKAIVSVVPRCQNHDGVGNHSAKRISAPPTFPNCSNSRTSGERLEPLSEMKKELSSPDVPYPLASSAVRQNGRTTDSSVRHSLVEEQPAGLDDELEEWGKIGDILTSFNEILTRPNVSCSDRQLSAEYVRSLTEDESVQSVGDWLADMNLQQYESTLVANGYDNMDFMGADVLDENDLLEIGVLSSDHRQRILDASSKLPCVPVCDHTEVKDWLNFLQLSDYLDSFVKNNFNDMSRVRRMWEVDLTALIGVSRLGHRKRIMVSLKSDNQKVSNHQLFSSNGQRHPDFAELDQMMNWNSPLLAVSVDDITESAARKQEITDQQSNVDGDSETRTNAVEQPDPMIGSQWLHRPESLIKGHCNYSAQYLGSTLVAALEGTESTKSSICRLKKSMQNIAKIPSITLSISFKGVKFINPGTKQIICEHEIGNIFCACQDSDDLNVFAYITRDLPTDKHYCHVFVVPSTTLATEVILTLGEAFEVAYQMALQENNPKPAAADEDAGSQDRSTRNSTVAGGKAPLSHKPSYSTVI